MKRFALSILHGMVGGESKWWMLYDFLVAFVAINLAFLYAPKAVYIETLFAHMLYAFPVLLVVAGNVSGLYEKNILSSFRRLFLALFLAALLATIFLSLYSNVIMYEKVGRYVLLAVFLVTFSLSGAVRIFGYLFARHFKIRVLVVGPKEALSEISKKLKFSKTNYLLVGFCDGIDKAAANVVGGVNDIPKICQDHSIDLIVIENSYTKIPYVLDKCFEPVQKGCNLIDEGAFFEQAFESVLVEKIDPGCFYAANLSAQNNLQAIVKRAMDVSVATLGLVVTGGMLPIVWVAAKIFTKGPLFYTQIRTGRFGKPFRIYKFCTMHKDAETNGAQWAVDSDSRITKIGRFLRKTRLDELPQFWNVLKGDMSFVGPRPERPELVHKIEEEVPLFSFRHWVKPGMTGFAQTQYRYAASVKDARVKLKYDLYYIKNWSVLLDIRVILRTISTVMRGAR